MRRANVVTKLVLTPTHVSIQLGTNNKNKRSNRGRVLTCDRRTLGVCLAGHSFKDDWHQVWVKTHIEYENRNNEHNTPTAKAPHVKASRASTLERRKDGRFDSCRWVNRKRVHEYLYAGGEHVNRCERQSAGEPTPVLKQIHSQVPTYLVIRIFGTFSADQTRCKSSVGYSPVEVTHYAFDTLSAQRCD